ncbi:MAG TPA: RDD family protein [Candidatus Dormibacteraeota bacterium]|nr:RDD family protein [Candidatus Dormibacteraeota bacterium]
MDPVTRNAPAAGIETASLWARTLAIVVDLLVVSVIQSVVNGVFGSEHITNAVLDPSTSGGYSSFTSNSATVDGVWLWVAAISYFALLEGLFGNTVGKAAVRIRVTDLSGRAAGWRAVVIRNVLRLIDSLPGFYLVGALVARFSPRRQRIGDHLAGTLVVPNRAAVGPGLSAEQRRRRLAVLLGVMVLFVAGSGAFAYWGRSSIALGDAARRGELPGGPVGTFYNGPAEWAGGSVSYPVTYTLARSGKHCTGRITLDWRGFLGGWQISGGESNCQ